MVVTTEGCVYNTSTFTVFCRGIYIPDSDVLVTEWIIIILSMKDAIQALHTCRASLVYDIHRPLRWPHTGIWQLGLKENIHFDGV